MTRPFAPLVTLALGAILFAGCGSSGSAAEAPGADGGARPPQDGGAGEPPQDGTPDAGGDALVIPPLPPRPQTVRTAIVVGDSYAEAGATPTYASLLHGDLAAAFPGLAFYDVSEPNAAAEDLPRQIKKLPTTLAGPVVVFLTTGRTELRQAAGTLLSRSDQAGREGLRENMMTALALLRAPERFGHAVAVTVYSGTIIDPSDDTGNFLRCKSYLGEIRGLSTPSLYRSWNRALIEPYANDKQGIVDLRARFLGHGIAASDAWVTPDCLAPNAKGHEQIRAAFRTAVLGR